MSQIEKAASWVIQHRNDVGNITRAVNRAASQFRVNQTELMKHILQKGN